MYKVLLVDDEPFFRKGLIKSVDWESCGFSICGEAENGEEAIQKVEELSPHLLITDIKMPAVNGLKLIEHVVTSMDKTIKFFVLSGYSDFAYAQTAIQYGVRNYILKPVNIEEFTKSLKSMYDELQKDRRADRERRHSIKIIVENAVKKLIRGEADGEIKQVVSKWLTLGQEDELTCVLVEMDGFDKMLDTLEEKEIMRHARRFKTSVLEAVGRINALHIYEEEIYRCCLMVTKQILSEYFYDVKYLVEALRKPLPGNPGPSVSVFVGEKVTGLSEAKRAYETAVRVRNCKFFQTGSCALYYSEIKKMEYSYNYLNHIPLKQLLYSIEHGKAEEINQIIQGIYSLFKEKRLAPELVRIYINNIVLEVLGFISETDQALPSQLDLKQLLEVNADQITLEEAMEDLSAFCIRSASIIREVRESTSQPVICKVFEYVEKNFRNDIYLTGIADIFQMNPVYLGQLFKKQYGVYFNDYLNKLRISESKKLLANTDMKISSIAKSIGYANAEYFVSRFEKSTSITPMQYRRITRNSDGG